MMTPEQRERARSEGRMKYEMPRPEPTAPTLEEAIAWLEQQAGLARRLAEQLREYPRAFQPSEGDRIEREAALSALALEAARAGQRLRDGRAEAIAALDRADAMVDALCQPRDAPGARRWLMSIPARPDHDPDLVISMGLTAARRLIEPAEQPVTPSAETEK